MTKPLKMRTCCKCGVSKHEAANFVQNKTPDGKRFKDVCRDCTTGKAMKTKVCSRCDRKLPITAYCVRGSGHRSECKECAAADRRKSRGIKAIVVPRKTADDPKFQAWLDLGLEWRRAVYDPFNASNRYGSLRT